MKAFLNKLMEDKIPSFHTETLTFEQQAQDLVFEADNLSPAKGRKKIIEALELDPNCIEAYEYLGIKEPDLEIGIAFFNMGVTIGRQLWGNEYLKDNKGVFWGLHETRPFMRCLQSYADCLNSLGKIEDSVAIMEEMIELNPNDNQGIRNILMLNLIELNENQKFEKYAKMFKGEETAFYLFNLALNAFKTQGEGVDANQKLSVALKQNKFVAAKLLYTKKTNSLSKNYGLEDDNEAKYYTIFSQFIWDDTDGALAWLKKHNVN